VFALIYFAPHYDKRKHEKILQIIREIKTVHSIETDIIQLRVVKSQFGEYVDENHEKEIYEKLFKPKAKLLKYRLGEPIRLLLRSRRGRGHFYIAGTVAITRNQEIEWFAPTYPNFFKEYDEDSSIGFLKAVLEKGVPLIEKLCGTLPPSKLETFILQKFRQLSPLKGSYETEVKVGEGLVVQDKYGKETRVAQKSIDAVCHTLEADWVLEIKQALNYASIGEVLVYSYLYKHAIGKPVRMGIVCEEIDHELIEVCKSLRIVVFQVNDDIKIYN
jgi:hypothetical protein